MATYYVKNAGNDALDGLSDANAWETISKVNGEVYSGDDNVFFNRGDEWREQLNVPSAGSAGSPITFGAYGSGDNPIINGSDLVTTWGDEGGDVWSASFDPTDTLTVAKVFFDGVYGTKEANQASLNAANEWYYDSVGNILYVYSTSDPDTAYTSPGIEATSRKHCIFITSKNYITVDNIDCHKPNRDGVKIDGTSHTASIQNLIVFHTGQQGIIFNAGASNTYLYNVRTTYCGVTSSHHGVYVDRATTNNGTFLIEECELDNTVGGWGLHCWTSNYGGTVKNSIAHDNARSGFLAGNLSNDTDIAFEYCISYSNSDGGFEVYYNGETYNGNNDITWYNCTAYDNGTEGGYYIRDNPSADTNVIMRNCISYEDGKALNETNNSCTFNLDYNCYYKASGTMITFGGNNYTQAQFASYQSTESQDPKGISTDPLFIDVSSFDFALQSTSPCIDVGVDVGLGRDYAGVSVPQGSAPDIGAYEYEYEQETPSAQVVVFAGRAIMFDTEEITEVEDFWRAYQQVVQNFEQATPEVE